jgi:hypothetical protein
VDLKRTDALGTYAREINFALVAGEGAMLRHARTRVASMTLDAADSAALSRLDADVITTLVVEDTDALADYLLADDPAAPLAHWWWHLGAIHARRYPSDLLPEHLRAAYLA